MNRSAFLLTLVVGASAPSLAPAEICPQNNPEWMDGRIIVWEPNLEPPVFRGVGEVFVYAYERGDSTVDTRFIAVTDPDGYFCIHDTSPGDWVITVFEPFVFRPIVAEITCTAGECDAGEIRVDQMIRISDDYLDYGPDWYGYSFAQTLLMPEGAVSVAKMSFRSGGGDNVEVLVYDGVTAQGPTIGSSWLRVPGPGGRDSALFVPGALAVEPGQVITVVGQGGWAPWRTTGDSYPDGQGYTLDGEANLQPIADTDISVAADIDGPDGNLTNFLVLASDGAYSGTTFAQSFVARTRAVTHASVFTGPPDGLRRMQASIGASPDGPAIGPVKETKGLQQQGVAFAWFDGEVPVTPGETYYLRITYPEQSHVTYTRHLDPAGNDLYPGGSLAVDGNAVSGYLWGRILGPAPRVDTGVDAGPGGGDGGSGGPDAGDMINPVPEDGCGCRANSAHRESGAIALFLVVFLFAANRRRRTG